MKWQTSDCGNEWVDRLEYISPHGMQVDRHLMILSRPWTLTTGDNNNKDRVCVVFWLSSSCTECWCQYLQWKYLTQDCTGVAPYTGTWYRRPKLLPQTREITIFLPENYTSLLHVFFFQNQPELYGSLNLIRSTCYIQGFNKASENYCVNHKGKSKIWEWIFLDSGNIYF